MDSYLDPRDLCRSHLLANHNEAHQLAGYLANAHLGDGGHLRKLLGHAARGQIDLTELREWHDACAREMVRRGYIHESPLEYDLNVPIGAGAIGRASTNRVDRRCSDCRVRLGVDDEPREDARADRGRTKNRQVAP